MKGMCNTCEKILVCKKLCPEAEKYANQDEIKQAGDEVVQRIIENIAEDEHFWYVKEYEEDLPLRYKKAKWRTLIINLYIDGFSSIHIAYHVPYTARQIRRIIAEYKQGRTF